MLSDLRVFIVGILKNVTNNDDNQQFLLKQNAVPILLDLMRTPDLQERTKEAQFLIQATALLRNFASSAKNQQLFIDHDALGALTVASIRHGSDEELQLNIARVWGKLLLHDAPCDAFVEDPSHLRQLVRTLRAHAGAAPLVTRLAFVLGNLSARSDRLRKMLMVECDGMTLIPSLLDRYWQEDRRHAQADAASGVLAPQTSDTERCAARREQEAVLVKLVRLVANVTISASVGTVLASTSSVVDPLLDIISCKKMEESEELVLSATAAVTNLLFYDSEVNLLSAPGNKQRLCQLLRPMVLESYNVEALVEAARALGNLTRHDDARRWIMDLRIDEALCILLLHGDRDLVFYAGGALVNLAADPEASRRLVGVCGVGSRLASLLGDTPEDDIELFLVAVKVFANLCLDTSVMTAIASTWPTVDLEALRQGLARAAAAAQVSVTAEAAAAAEELGESAANVGDGIAANLAALVTLVLGYLPPPCEVDVQDQRHGAGEDEAACMTTSAIEEPRVGVAC